MYTALKNKSNLRKVDHWCKWHIFQVLMGPIPRLRWHLFLKSIPSSALPCAPVSFIPINTNHRCLEAWKSLPWTWWSQAQKWGIITSLDMFQLDSAVSLLKSITISLSARYFTLYKSAKAILCSQLSLHSLISQLFLCVYEIFYSDCGGPQPSVKRLGWPASPTLSEKSGNLCWFFYKLEWQINQHPVLHSFVSHTKTWPKFWTAASAGECRWVQESTGEYGRVRVSSSES